jgi:hypothetical protein
MYFVFYLMNHAISLLLTIVQHLNCCTEFQDSYDNAPPQKFVSILAALCIVQTGKLLPSNAQQLSEVPVLKMCITSGHNQNVIIQVNLNSQTHYIDIDSTNVQVFIAPCNCSFLLTVPRKMLLFVKD